MRAGLHILGWKTTPFASTIDRRSPFDIGPRLFAKKSEPKLKPRLSPRIGFWIESSLCVVHCVPTIACDGRFIQKQNHCRNFKVGRPFPTKNLSVTLTCPLHASLQFVLSYSEFFSKFIYGKKDTGRRENILL